MGVGGGADSDLLPTRSYKFTISGGANWYSAISVYLNGSLVTTLQTSGVNSYNDEIIRINYNSSNHNWYFYLNVYGEINGVARDKDYNFLTMYGGTYPATSPTFNVNAYKHQEVNALTKFTLSKSTQSNGNVPTLTVNATQLVANATAYYDSDGVGSASWWTNVIDVTIYKSLEINTQITTNAGCYSWIMLNGVQTNLSTTHQTFDLSNISTLQFGGSAYNASARNTHLVSYTTMNVCKLKT